MAAQYSVLILGASYGSLLGIKLALAGHDVHLVCLPNEARLINAEGAVVVLPVRGRDEPVELCSKDLPGRMSAGGADEADPSQYDLVALAMQEPQYGAPGVRELLARIARSHKPCISIMNMPPLPFMQRIVGEKAYALHDCYTDASVWKDFDPALVSLASPDPQAYRPPDRPANVLQVGLPTNFKLAEFEGAAPNRIIRDLEAQIGAARYAVNGEEIALPVKLKVHASLYVPLAKWSMLIAGNYRCIQDGDPRAIREAVHSDPQLAEKVYRWVGDLCVALGAGPDDMVPFEKYAAAAQGLGKPSSVARAIAAGAKEVERVDRLVQALGRQLGRSLPELDAIVELVDTKLAANRQAA